MRKIIASLFIVIVVALLPSSLAGAGPLLAEINFFTPTQEVELTSGVTSGAETHGTSPVLEVIEGREAVQQYAPRQTSELGNRDLNTNNEFIPSLKNNEDISSISNGVKVINEASSSERPALKSSPFSFNMDLFWLVISSIIGLLTLAASIYLVMVLRASARIKSEALRQSENNKRLAKFIDELRNSPGTRANFTALTTSRNRLKEVVYKVNYNQSDTEEVMRSALRQIEKLVIELRVNYSNIDPHFYKRTLAEGESIDSYAARILGERLDAKKAYDEIIALEEAVETEKLHQAKLRATAFTTWEKLSQEDKEMLALSEGLARNELAEIRLPNYSDEEQKAFYNSFANKLQSYLQDNAKQAFERLPRYTREKIARANGSQREQYLQQYIPGLNPALTASYMISAGDFINSPSVEHARTNQNDSSSFGD